MNGAVGLITVLLSGGFLYALIRLYKARAEKDSIIVGSAEDLATIAKGVAEAVYAELERTRTELDACRADRDDWRQRALRAEARLVD